MLKSATDPSANVTIRAAAGTGKTWLLTSRLVSLLLRGVPPGSILAITFTRKAAAEIYRRLSERLLAMASAEETEVCQQLLDLGIDPTNALLSEARDLFERLLSAEHELRTTTFHAFCQEILRRFPLEAEVSPGVELLESTTELEQTAWRALEHEATRNPSGPLALAIDTLLQVSGGAFSVRRALQAFLEHRNDWWAYTEGEADPLAFAERQLRILLAIDDKKDPPFETSADAAIMSSLQRYVELLSRHPTATNLDRVAQLESALKQRTLTENDQVKIEGVFLTASAQIRKVTRSQRLEANLGKEACNEFLSLHTTIGKHLKQFREHRLRRQTFAISMAWYRCGQCLLDHYQRLKSQQGSLDFNDLEWKTYRLLNRSQHAEWIQYKLDQRIDHLLVDEFQDTNPTQWRLLLPLLKEMAAGNTQRRRSVFIVGDEKQSIYGFRRADPGLFNTAQKWLTDYVGAAVLTQDKSRRSSSAIVQFVNLVFGNRKGAETSSGSDNNGNEFELQNFRNHSTHYEQRWGRVELLPLVRWAQPSSIEIPTRLRNPLRQPRKIEKDERYREEGRLVTDKISALIGQTIDDEGVRPLDYDDIMILLRDRTHAVAYESALRHAGIPYVGAGHGTFVACLEVQDLMHLLRCLVVSYDNLALASALRSPVFACSNEHLTLLAGGGHADHWRERLAKLATALPEHHPLARAHHLIERWSDVADTIPVHDLLDRIYSEGNVIARYVSSSPSHLQIRVEANLRRFLQLALELDHGRYPSLSRFLSRVPLLADADRYALADLTSSNRSHVRIMTIHAAKGLEKPVVFLVDAMRDYRGRNTGLRTLVDWPVESARPEHLHLIGKNEDLDNTSRQILDRTSAATQREETNLLYVALTRAKHALFISACEPGRRTPHGWYHYIEKRIKLMMADNNSELSGLDIKLTADHAGGGVVIEQGVAPAALERPNLPSQRTEEIIDPALAKPLKHDQGSALISPSTVGRLQATEIVEPAGPVGPAYVRGIVIHRMLRLLTSSVDRTAVEENLRLEFQDTLSRSSFGAYWREACTVVNLPEFKPFFDPREYEEARNEMPILFRHKGKNVYGAVDRLVIRKNEICILDYKTHKAVQYDEIVAITDTFYSQMHLYATGIRKLWPTHKLRVLLLFTALPTIVDISTAIESEKGCPTASS
jgi:ATP-dependent helicase/nuclease subunit A